MTRPFYTQVVVHAVIPAHEKEEALELLCERIRKGIGPEPHVGPRLWNIAIAAGEVAAEGEKPTLLLNEEWARRMRALPEMKPLPNEGEVRNGE